MGSVGGAGAGVVAWVIHQVAVGDPSTREEWVPAGSHRLALLGRFSRVNPFFIDQHVDVLDR